MNEAVAALQAGDPVKASKLTRELLETLTPEVDAGFAGTLADLCMHCELWFDAARLYAPLCRLRPDVDFLRYRAGTACYKSGQLGAAREHFAKCTELKPENPASYLQLGHIQRALRDFEGAEKSYIAYIERSTDEKASGYWSLSDLRKYRFSDEMIAEIGRYLGDIGEDGPEKSITHFALGIAAEQREDYENAYRNFHSANEIQAQLRPFRADAYEHLIDGLVASDATAVAAAPATTSRPIFIVGLPRSGTTLVEQILAAHSSVVATDELPYMERIALELEQSGGYGQRLAALTDDEVSQYRDRYLREARQYVDDIDCHFVDKNPNNFLHIGLIRRLLPEALIINLRRDLRDNATSVYRQLFVVGHDYSATFGGIETYVKGYLRLMSHWLESYPDAIRVQGYEDLVNDPDDQIGELLEFCGLDSEPGCFEFYKSKQAVKTPSAGQVSQPMYRSSIGQWRHYDEWLGKEFSRLADLSGAE
jgi:tetratricopeptide (TPR) repeat protein